MADFDLGQRVRTLLGQQDAQELNLGRLFNQLQDLLGADTSLKVPLRDLFGREVFRKLLLAQQPSQKLAYKDALVQDLQSVYSPALVARLEAFLNGVIGSDAGEQTSQLQPPVSQPSAPLPKVVLKGPLDEDVATVMASDLPAAAAASELAAPAAAAPPAAAPTAPSSAASGRASALLPASLLRPLLIGGGAVVVLLGVVLVSSRRPCPGGMQCSLASSFGLIKLSEAAITERYTHIKQERDRAAFVPDLENRRREVTQLQAELKRGSYSSALAANLQSLDEELAQQIAGEQGYYDQYKKNEAVVSAIGVVKTEAEARRLEAAAKELNAVPKSSLVYKAARYQAALATTKLRPFVAETKAAQMQKLMIEKEKEMRDKESKVRAQIAAKEREARKEMERLKREAEKAGRNNKPAAPPPKPAARPAAPVNNDTF